MVTASKASAVAANVTQEAMRGVGTEGPGVNIPTRAGRQVQAQQGDLVATWHWLSAPKRRAQFRKPASSTPGRQPAARGGVWGPATKTQTPFSTNVHTTPHHQPAPARAHLADTYIAPSLLSHHSLLNYLKPL